MSIISPLPYTIVNGSVIDADPVMADFNQIVNNVNSNAAAINGSSTQVFNVETASLGSQAVPLAQALGQFAALNGNSGQVFNVAAAATGTEAVPLAQVQADFAAINGSAAQVFNVATAATGTEAVPLGQAQTNFAAINGNSGQVFNVATATTVTEAVALGQLTAPAPNLLVNGSAEFGNLDWLLPPQAGYQTGTYGEGTYFTISSAVNGTYVAISADYAVEPGIALALQAEIFASGLTAGDLVMDLEFLDSTHTPILANQAESTVSADQTWTFLSNSATTPANTAYWHARFFMQGATLTSGALRKIKVSNGTTPSPYSREADFPAIQANFAALNGNSGQVFNVANAVSGTQAVPLAQVANIAPSIINYAGGTTANTTYAAPTISFTVPSNGYVMVSAAFNLHALASFGNATFEILINGAVMASDTPSAASAWSLNATVAGTAGATMTVVAQYIVGGATLSNDIFIRGFSMYLPAP
jgi:hypothetical protein